MQCRHNTYMSMCTVHKQKSVLRAFENIRLLEKKTDGRAGLSEDLRAWFMQYISYVHG